MKRIPIEYLLDKIGEKVAISGWVNVVRDQRERQFVVLRDITGMVQLFNPKRKETEELSNKISSLTKESVIEVVGVVSENKEVKLNGFEVVVEEINVLSLAKAPIPIQKTSSLDSRMDWRWINLRDQKTKMIFEIQTFIEHAMRRYWINQGFTEIHSPKLMGAASEGGAELFEMPYFKTKACLAQSPQFYKQMAMAAGFEKIFEIGPVFRANPSFTSRHDTEFTSIDAEISWVKSHEDVMKSEEEWLEFVFTELVMTYGDKIKSVFGQDVVIPKIPFPRITMDEAVKILADMNHEIPGTSKDLDPEGERKLSKYISKRYKHEFVFITDYPISVRPFYHMRYEDRPEVTKSYDLLWRGLEVTTGAQREHRPDILVKQAEEKGVDVNTIKDYINFFSYGCPPHGGYGFGLTRMLMLLLGYNNVREVTYLYRGPTRLTP